VKILSVVGARPNFMKIAPIIEEMRRHRQITNYLVHTGQHYNKELSDFFFRDLNMPKPQVHLGVGSGSHAEQTAKILTGVEKILISKKPDLVIVVGDCNSTIGGALAAAKLNIPVAHVEAGLRSFNMKMPEEKNRILTDHIADLLFTTEESANKNLAREGIPMEKIKFVGNVMIDSLKKHKKHAMKSKILEKIGVRKGKYVVLTMHRPENTDHKDILKGIIDALDEIQEKIDLVWPLHPRAKKQLIKFGLFNRIKKMKNLHLID
jgi:UDP-N-acetylglucosamine 2-epimerase (non-hydrolysing)